MNIQETIDFTEFSFEGHAQGTYKEKPVRAFGVLSGETANIHIYKKKRNIFYARPQEILKKSKERIPKKEDHYVTCSPWQIMPYDIQCAHKKELLRHLYEEEVRIDDFFISPVTEGYRTKVEYSFTEVEGKLLLAFHTRGRKYDMDALSKGCMLASPAMNDAAQAILAILQEKNITLDDLKTLILRESKSKKTCIAILYVKNKQAGETLKNVSHFLLGINGFLVIYSNPLSPASKTTAVLHVSGDNFLEEVIKNRTIKYGFDSFFQNNMPVFENALEIIQKETAGAQCVADLYCGAGTIGICLAEKNQRMIGVEIDEHAALRAKENALSNNIVPYEAYELSAEKTEKEILQKADVIIVDPPRSGLHPKLTKTILECTPKKIIYLSCNPKTQHDDMLLLLQNYTPIKLYGFDFYPQTPHMESLLICFKK